MTAAATTKTLSTSVNSLETHAGSSGNAGAGLDRLVSAHYRALYDAEPNSIIIVDSNCIIIEVNQAACALLGSHRDALLGAPVQKHLTGARSLAGREEEELFRHLPRGTWQGSLTVRRTDGAALTLSSRIEAPLGAEGGFRIILSDQPSAPHAHELSQARLATIIAATRAAIVIESLDGAITDWCGAAERLYGYTAPEVIGQPSTILVPPDGEHSDQMQRLLQRVHRGERVAAADAVRRHRNGHLLEVSLELAPARNDRGDVIAAMTIIHDIMARGSAESGQRATLLDRGQLLDHISDGVVVLDLDWRFTYINPTAEAMLILCKDELIGMSIWQAVPAAVETPLYPALQQARSQGEAVDVDIYYPPFDRWFNVRAFPSSEGVTVYLRDVTSGKQQEQELRNALAAARPTSQATDEFLAMISHELRTPMQAVLGYADLLLAGAKSRLTEDQIEDVRYIQQGSQRMIALIDQMLELSRLQAGRLDLTIEPVDLTMIVDQVRQDILPLAAAKGLDLFVDVPSSLPLVQGDSARLRQILLSLAENAVKFTAAGWVRVTARATPDHVELAVSDSGVGIPADALDHIFEEFRQVDSSSTRRFGGAGLGLAIARELAEQQGGSITVVSEPHVGSTFTLRLAARTLSRPAKRGKAARASHQRRTTMDHQSTAQAV